MPTSLGHNFTPINKIRFRRAAAILKNYLYYQLQKYKILPGNIEKLLPLRRNIYPQTIQSLCQIPMIWQSYSLVEFYGT